MKAAYSPYRFDDAPASCGLCGRMLGAAFHYTCHVCGAAYCYAHRPDRCSHDRPMTNPQEMGRDGRGLLILS